MRQVYPVRLVFTSKIKRTDRFLIAVSGGIDSMVLLHRLRQRFPATQLGVAHFDHRVRPESAKDAEWVRNYCREVKIAYFSGGRSQTGVSEGALRIARRKFLERVRQEAGFDWIVTAHHLDDQLETLLMRLIRGTGIRGLGAMRVREGRYWKPLLRVTKHKIYRYAARHAVGYRSDPTNDSVMYFRNRVRHELVPVFKKLSRQYGGYSKFLNRVGAMTRDLQRASVSLRGGSVIGEENAFWYRVSDEAFKNLSAGQQKELIRYVVQKLGGELPTRAEVDAFVAAICAGQSRYQGAHSIEVLISCAQIYFQGPKERSALIAFRQAADWQSQWLRLFPGTLKDLSGFRLWRPGDRFSGKKLKTLLLAARVPRPEREFCIVSAPESCSEVRHYLQPGKFSTQSP